MPNSMLLGVTSIKMENRFYVAGMVGKDQECIYLMKSGNGFKIRKCHDQICTLRSLAIFWRCFGEGE